MEVRLSPELEAVVRRGVEGGRYDSAEAYVAEAVELLQEREQWLGETLQEERAKLEAAFQEAERDERMSAEDFKQEMDDMKAEWAARRRRA